jgi:hypothetical protein
VRGPCIGAVSEEVVLLWFSAHNKIMWVFGLISCTRTNNSHIDRAIYLLNKNYSILTLTLKLYLLMLSRPVTGLEWPREFQEVKVLRFHDNGTGWW